MNLLTEEIIERFKQYQLYSQEGGENMADLLTWLFVALIYITFLKD